MKCCLLGDELLLLCSRAFWSCIYTNDMMYAKGEGRENDVAIGRG